MSNSKPHRTQLIKKLQEISLGRHENSSCRILFMLPTVENYGQEVGFNTIKPFESKIAAIHKSLSRTTKNYLMRFIGPLD